MCGLACEAGLVCKGALVECSAKGVMVRVYWWGCCEAMITVLLWSGCTGRGVVIKVYWWRCRGKGVLL